MNRIEVSLQLMPWLTPFVYVLRPRAGRLVVVMQDGIDEHLAMRTVASLLSWEERDALRAGFDVASMAEHPDVLFPSELHRFRDTDIAIDGGRIVQLHAAAV